jgi:hypothetical protein
MYSLQTKSIAGLTVVLVVLLVLQFLKLNYLAPPPEYIWDNVYLWDWARNFGHGDFSTFVADSHHQLRWGNWGFAAILIQSFSDSILVYYLSTLIPSTIAAIIFSYIAWRYIGSIPAMAFVVLWFFDALLFRASFQLLPSGSALLPVALLVWLSLRLVQHQGAGWKSQIAMALCIFWLYGTKETHLAYLPGILWLVYRVSGWRGVAFQLGVFSLGYLAETLVFLAISSEFSILGRIYAIANGGQHVQLMTEEARYVNQQTQYFDSGITMRWVLTSGVTPIPIFMGFVIAVLCGSRQVREQLLADSQPIESAQRRAQLIQVLSVLILSFMIFTTFFVIQLNPIRLGHPLVPRYVTTLMPLIYLIIIAYLSLQVQKAPMMAKIALLVTLPFFVAPAIERYSGYRELSVFRISNDYHTFAAKLANFQCVRARQRAILFNQLDLVPQQYRDERISRLIRNKSEVVFTQPWFIANSAPGTPCENTYTIHRITPMRY